MMRYLALFVVVLLTSAPVSSAPRSDPAWASCRQKEDPDRAIPACTMVLGQPGDAHARAVAFYFRGEAYAKKRDFDRAIADYSQAIRIEPHRYALRYHRRGTAYQERGDLDRAIADYDEAIRLDPTRAYRYHARGTAYEAKGDRDRAIVEYTEAIRHLDARALHDPTYAYYFNFRGNAFRARGDYDRAIADYDAAIRLDPSHAFRFHDRGNAYEGKGAYELAIRDYEQGLRIDPRDPVLLVDRGNAYRSLGRIDAAVADYSQAILLNPRFAPAFLNRALAYEKAGDVPRATADFEAALRIDPSHQEARAGRDRLAQRHPGPVVPHSTNENRIALVIGNIAYEAPGIPVLPNPVRDAEALARALREDGFKSVTLQRNLGREALVKALSAFAAQAVTADWAVVYYAGHGLEMDNTNYLVPVDAKLGTDRDVRYEAVSMDDVLAAVEGAKRLRLVILDACRNNPFVNRMTRTLASRSIGRGLAKVEPEGGVLVAYAAKHGQVALDGEGGNSPFVAALVRRLKTPGLEVRRLFDLVRDDVLDATGRQQQPFTYGSLSGREDFYFVPPVAR